MSYPENPEASQSSANWYGHNQMYQQSNVPIYSYPVPTQLPQELFQSPMVRDMAMECGNTLMGSGCQMVDKEFTKYVSMPLLRRYFAVDVHYVGRKLQLLLFPYSCSDWSRQFWEDGLMEPRKDVHSPDLYIPLMAFITYVLAAGMALGTQNRFSPDALPTYATQALAWTAVEIGVHMIAVYISNINMHLGCLELLAFSGYKYVGISISLLVGLVFFRRGYYAALFYCSMAFVFYLVRSLTGQVLNENSYSRTASPYMNKRRMCLILSFAFTQPFLMWWLSFSLVQE